LLPRRGRLSRMRCAFLLCTGFSELQRRREKYRKPPFPPRPVAVLCVQHAGCKQPLGLAWRDQRLFGRRWLLAFPRSPPEGRAHPQLHRGRGLWAAQQSWPKCDLPSYCGVNQVSFLSRQDPVSTVPSRRWAGGIKVQASSERRLEDGRQTDETSGP